MKILWIPHNTWEPGRHQRDQYFIERLAVGHEIHVALWESCLNRTEYLNPLKHLAALRYYRRSKSFNGHGVMVHHVPRALDVTRRLRGNPTKALALNHWMVWRTIARIVRRHGIEVVICGPNAPLIGFPPVLGVPLVFDFVDGSTEISDDNVWWRMEEEYFRRTDAVLCVSQGMVDRVRHQGRQAILLPNGADLRRMRNASGDEVRAKFGLNGRKVVSLIGLTCSERDYFIRAIERLRQQDPAIACLLVGHRSTAERLLGQVRPEHRRHFIYAGEVPYEEIAGYFAASDVGLYPVEEEPYYHNASPIKALEYGAAGKPVVAPRLRELMRLNLPHVVFAPPTLEDFSAGIWSALHQPKPVEADLREFDWANLAERLEEYLRSLIAEIPDERKVLGTQASRLRFN